MPIENLRGLLRRYASLALTLVTDVEEARDTATRRRRVSRGERSQSICASRQPSWSMLDMTPRRVQPLAAATTRLEGEIADRERADAERCMQCLETTKALAGIGRMLSRSLDSGVVGRVVTESLCRLLDSRAAALYQLDPVSANLVLQTASSWAAGGFRWASVLPMNTSLLGAAARERRAVAAPDVLGDPRVRYGPELRAMAESTTDRAILALPLETREGVRGVLAVADRTGRVFDEDDVAVARAFADQAALAIENARLHEETQTRLGHTETLLAVSQAIGSTHDLTEAFRRTIRAMVHALGADAGGAWRSSTGRDELVPVAGYHLPAELIASSASASIPGHDPLLAEIRQIQGPICWSESETEPWLFAYPWARQLPAKSFLALPLRTKDDFVGLLAVVWLREAHSFTAEERSLVEGIARQAAIALENMQLIERLQTRQARLEALLEASRQLSRIQPLESLLKRIAEACGHLVDSNSVGFRILEGDELVVAGAWGEPWPTPRLKVGESLSGAVALTGQPLVVNDLAADPRLLSVHDEALRELGHQAWLGMPVRIGERVAGVLSIRTRRTSGFTGEDQAIAAAFASQAATAIENARLYQEVQRAYEEVARTQAQLVQAQKMEAVGRLAGGVAHDFNNLMTVVIGRAELLRERLGAGADLARHVDLIRKTADRAASVTRQLLAFSRKQVLQPTVMDLNALVGRMGAMLRPLIGEDIELVTVAGADLWRVRIDAGQFEQVLMNLAVNARDAMPRGGRLTIETGNVVLDDRHGHGHHRVEPGAYVMLAVGDTGTGMDRETLSHIFEPFFTTKEPGAGTGLGLAMVYGIVKQSGGEISVDSEPGHGATFTIYLPRVDAPETEQADTECPAPPRGSETILLVEDEEPVRDLIREALEAQGYRVLGASDAREALAICEDEPGAIDLVLTDVIMPGMSGVELTRRLTATRPEVQVLYMSGYTDTKVEHHGVLAADTEFLQKPFSPADVAWKVRKVLGGARRRRQRERS